MSGFFPRLPAQLIEREKIGVWLTRYRTMPLRLLIAPAGSGKTTALVSYAQSRQHPVYYVHLKNRSADRSLEVCLQELFQLETFTYAHFLEHLQAREHLELIIDGIDRAFPSEITLLERLAYEVPGHVALLYAGTTTTLAVHSLEVAGLASILPRETLLFSYDETAALCELYGFSKTDESIVDVYDRCDGWPLAVADVLRCASEQGAALFDAYDTWLAQHSRAFTAYLQDEIGRFRPDTKEYFDRMLSGEILSLEEATRLEDGGCFTVHVEHTIRLYRLVFELLGRPVPKAPAHKTRLKMRMFGRFSLRCGSREVSWIRRRDQQIFRYIAMRPNGQVKRSEILETFWPDADPHLAAQSYRTACSNIRKALTAIMGAETVEHLFATDGQELKVDIEQTVIDVRRFKLHINEAHQAEEEERPADALAHYSAADRLYRADLFAGEPEEAWFLAQRQIYHDLALLARERIVRLGKDLKTFDQDAFEESDASAS